MHMCYFDDIYVYETPSCAPRYGKVRCLPNTQADIHSFEAANHRRPTGTLVRLMCKASDSPLREPGFESIRC